jgi:uncharacterized protein YoxC
MEDAQSWNPSIDFTKPLEKSLRKDFKGVDDKLGKLDKTLDDKLGDVDKDIKNLDTMIQDDVGKALKLISADVRALREYITNEETKVERSALKAVAALFGGVGVVLLMNASDSMYITAGGLMLVLAWWIVW